MRREAQAHAGADARTADRRTILGGAAGMAVGAGVMQPRPGGAAPAAQPAEEPKMLCDKACQSKLDAAELVTTPSGLQYRDIKVGKGVEPPKGFQVVCQYVAMIEEKGVMRVFESTLERNAPADIRVGAGQVIAGLDEGLSTMKPGGLRRLYVPGDLSFPKGLAAAPGRARVPPAAAIVMDVQLLLIPGFDLEEEDEPAPPAPAPAAEEAAAEAAPAEVVA